MSFSFAEVNGLWVVPVKVYDTEVKALVDTTLTRTVFSDRDASALTGLTVAEVLDVCAKRGGVKQKCPEHKHVDCYPLKLANVYVGDVKFDTFQCLVTDAFERSHIGLDMLRCMDLSKEGNDRTIVCSGIHCNMYSSVYDKHFKDIEVLSKESGNDLQQTLEKLASYSVTLYDAVTIAKRIPREMSTLVNGFLKMHQRFPMPIGDVKVGDTVLHDGAKWVVEKIATDDGAPILWCSSNKGVSGWVRDVICLVIKRPSEMSTGINVSGLLDELYVFHNELYSCVLNKQVPDKLHSVVDAFMHEYGMFPMPIENVQLGDAVLKDGVKYTVTKITKLDGGTQLHCQNPAGLKEYVLDDIVTVVW